MEINEKKRRKKGFKSRSVEKRKIPKSKLEFTVKFINDLSNENWKEYSTSCEKRMQYHNEVNKSELQLKYAATCLLSRDWQNLTKTILLFQPSKKTEHLIPIFAKYASICLAYTYHPLLEKVLKVFGYEKKPELALQKWTSLCEEDINMC